ncbi:MAG TPA: hypothetical protein VGG03_18655 [Thermoanaerobaculia bacterium]|jgi:hypothetical protein
MSTELQAAQAELAPDIQREINWFVGPGERHFVDPVTVSVVAGVCLSAFFTALVKGFGDEVGKETGKALGKWVVERVRAITSAREHSDPAQTERDAEMARAKLQRMDRAQVMVVFDQVEYELRGGFTEVMPEQRATKLATRIRHVAAKVVYEPGGTA